jgi:hypothetical protein
VAAFGGAVNVRTNDFSSSLIQQIQGQHHDSFLLFNRKGKIYVSQDPHLIQEARELCSQLQAFEQSAKSPVVSQQNTGAAQTGPITKHPGDEAEISEIRKILTFEQSAERPAVSKQDTDGAQTGPTTEHPSDEAEIAEMRKILTLINQQRSEEAGIRNYEQVVTELQKLAERARRDGSAVEVR